MLNEFEKRILKVSIVSNNYSLCLRNVCWLMNCTLRREEIFRKDTSQYTDTMIWQADVIEMCPYTRFNRGYHYIRTVIDMLSEHAWTAQS